MFNTLKDMDFTDKRVLLRVDFNVPLSEDGVIKDDMRIKAAIPTINEILKRGAKQILLLTHVGRPKGDIDDNLKTDSIARRLGELMKKEVVKVDDTIDIPIPEDKKLIMLENVRFRKAETENNEHFAKALAREADIYVNDAFGACHRKHASVHAITLFLPSCAGLLIEKEVKSLEKALKNPDHPFVAIIGGAKLETKIPVIIKLIDKVDKILIGGGMMFTFFKAQGFEIGESIVDLTELETARKIMKTAGDKFILPTDVVIADEPKEGLPSKVVGITKIPKDMVGLDIGPETIDFFVKQLKDAKTVLWNGTMGMNEIEAYNKGSKAIAKALASSKAQTIIGGGDTVSFVQSIGLDDKMSLVSSGGGATLDFLKGETLPAIKALEDAAER